MYKEQVVFTPAAKGSQAFIAFAREIVARLDQPLGQPLVRCFP